MEARRVAHRSFEIDLLHCENEGERILIWFQKAWAPLNRWHEAGLWAGASSEGAIPGQQAGGGRKRPRQKWGEHSRCCFAEQALLPEAGHFAMWDVSEQIFQKPQALKGSIVVGWRGNLSSGSLISCPSLVKFSTQGGEFPVFLGCVARVLRSHWGSQIPGHTQQRERSSES